MANAGITCPPVPPPAMTTRMNDSSLKLYKECRMTSLAKATPCSRVSKPLSNKQTPDGGVIVQEPIDNGTGDPSLGSVRGDAQIGESRTRKASGYVSVSFAATDIYGDRMRLVSTIVGDGRRDRVRSPTDW